MNERAAQLQELKAFFDKRELPQEVQLSQAIRIIDLPKFIESHMTAASLPDPRGLHEPFFLRLRHLKAALEQTTPAK